MAYIDDVNNILQIQPNGMPTVVRLSQNENGRNLYFTLSGNESAIPSTVTVTISGTKPDGNVYSGTGSITNNVILIEETVQMTAVAGTWDAKIQIISGGNTIATGRIRFVIDADTVEPGSVPSESELNGLVAQAQQYAEDARSAAYGSPLTASTASAMIDKTRVYVYTGSESGYTNGHWYYWNGSAWTDGGAYNSTGVQTDTTLSVSGVPADAKATGDQITQLKEDLTVTKDMTINGSGNAFVWESGGFDSQGVNADNPARARMQTYIPCEYYKSVTASSDLEMIIGVYNNDGSYAGYYNGSAVVSSVSWLQHADFTNISDKNFRIFIRYKANPSGEIVPVVGNTGISFESVLMSEVNAINTSLSDLDKTINGLNIFGIEDKESYTYGGLTISIEDGVISMSGTATGNVVVESSVDISFSGSYYFAGLPEGGGASQFYQQVYKSTTYKTEYGGGTIIELEKGTWKYRVVVVSGRTVDITVQPILLRIEPDSVFTPAILYGGWATDGKHPYAADYSTWANNRKRTDIVWLKKGSSFGVAKSNLPTTQMEVFEYHGFNPEFFVNRTVLSGTIYKWTADHDGFYAFNIRKTNGQAITQTEILTNCVFYFKGTPDHRPIVHFIGSGNLSETSTAGDVGDCTLITFYDGNNLLIDSANARNYTSVEKRLYSAGVKKIYNMILSHYHTDHVSGLIQMVSNGYIDISGATVYLPNATETQWAYDNGVMDNGTKTLWDQVMQILSEQNCTIVYPDTEWQTVSISDAFITFFNTDLSVYRNASTNYNDWSLCNYLVYGDKNICFSGDLGPVGQGILAKTLYKSNIYKADHHGWLNQANIPAGYIENVSPDVVIAEDGQTHDDLLVGNGAPLIRWCEDNGVPYYRKYQNNEIVVALDKQAYEFMTKVSRYYRPTT